MSTETDADLNDDGRVSASDDFPGSRPVRARPERQVLTQVAPVLAPPLQGEGPPTLAPASPTHPSKPVVSYTSPLSHHPPSGHPSHLQPRYGSPGGGLGLNTMQYFPYHHHHYMLQNSWHLHQPSPILAEQFARTTHGAAPSYLHDRRFVWVPPDAASYFDPPGAPASIRHPPLGSTKSDPAASYRSETNTAVGTSKSEKRPPAFVKEDARPNASEATPGSVIDTAYVDSAESVTDSGLAHTSRLGGESQSPSSVNPLRSQKNARARLRATQKKEYVEMLLQKDPRDVTEAEQKEIDKWEKRRSSKNERSRERSVECKEQMSRILAKSPSERTAAEENYLQLQLSRRTRKNEGDRLRRQRLRVLGISSAYKAPEIRVTARGPLQLSRGDIGNPETEALMAVDNDRKQTQAGSSQRLVAALPRPSNYASPSYGHGQLGPFGYVPSLGPYGMPLGDHFVPREHFYAHEYRGFPPGNPSHDRMAQPPSVEKRRPSPEQSESE